MHQACRFLPPPQNHIDTVSSIDLPPPKAGPNFPRGTVLGTSNHGLIKFTLRAIPLPQAIIEFLQANVSVVKKISQEAESRISTQKSSAPAGEEPMDSEPVAQDLEVEANGNEDVFEDPSRGAEGEVERKPTVRQGEFWTELEKLFAKAGPEWKDVTKRIWSFGPGRIGPNFFVDRRTGGTPHP